MEINMEELNQEIQNQNDILDNLENQNNNMILPIYDLDKSDSD